MALKLVLFKSLSFFLKHTCPHTVYIVYCPGTPIARHRKVAQGSYFWSHIQSGLPVWPWLIAFWPYGIPLYKRGNVWPRDGQPPLILWTTLLTLLCGIKVASNLSLETYLCPPSPQPVWFPVFEGSPDSAPAFVFPFRMWQCLGLGLCLCVVFAY